MLQDPLLASFHAIVQPASLAAQRAGSMARFTSLGLPTPRLEAWRFSDHRALRAALTTPATVAGAVSENDLAAYRLAIAGHCLVFVNGGFAPALSTIGKLPDGVWLGPLSEALQLRPDLAQSAFANTPDRSFAQLNSALAAEGMVLALDPGVHLDAPVALIHIRTAGGAPLQLRHLIALGPGAVATVVETATGSGAGSSNIVTRTVLGEGADLTHVKLQDESEAALHLALDNAMLAAGARLESFYMVLGAGLSRQEIDVALTGPNTSLALNGCCHISGRQEATIVPFVDHQTTGGRTAELFKTVLDGAAHGVFLGSILVREGANGIAAQQQNRNLLLSATARVDTKPELTILADEVKCSHGATVGDLDEAGLFYLMARGIDPVRARRMLVEAFAAEAIDHATLAKPIRDWLHAHLYRRIRAQEAAA